MIILGIDLPAFLSYCKIAFYRFLFQDQSQEQFGSLWPIGCFLAFLFWGTSMFFNRHRGMRTMKALGGVAVMLMFTTFPGYARDLTQAEKKVVEKLYRDSGYNLKVVNGKLEQEGNQIHLDLEAVTPGGQVVDVTQNLDSFPNFPDKKKDLFTKYLVSTLPPKPQIRKPELPPELPNEYWELPGESSQILSGGSLPSHGDGNKERIDYLES
jgi:hypothetical protein